MNETFRPTLMQYHWATWWLLATVSLALAAFSGVTHLPMALLAFAASVWCLLPERFARTKSSTSLPLLIAGVVIVASAVLFYFDRDLLYLIGGVLTGIFPYLLARKNRTFGYWIALLVAALLALTSIIVEGTAGRYLTFLFVLVTLVFNLNAANLLELSGGVAGAHQRLPPRYFRQFLPSLTVGLTIGALIFLIFPRSYRLYNPFGLRGRETVTGYTGQVTLDSGTNIRESSSLALTVETSDIEWLNREGPNLLFRGNTVDTFDGVHWSSNAVETEAYQPTSDVRFTRAYRFPARRLRVYREPHTTLALLYPHVLLSLSGPPRVMTGVRHDDSGNLMRADPELGRYVYDLVILETVKPKGLDRLTLEEIRVGAARGEENDRPAAWHLSPDRREDYLEIPDSIRKRDYFWQWLGTLKFEPSRTKLSEAFLALKRHFQNGFQATLVSQMGEGLPFENFLSKEKKGHCEYFATAAALFFRAYGIPSRLVLGYRGGTFNAVSRVLEVRELSAHAWVEIYLPGEGWVAYDPTPLSPPGPEAGWKAQAQLYLSALNFWFNRYVVNYNSQTQKQLWEQFKPTSTGGLKWVTVALKNAVPYLVVGFLICFAIWVSRFQSERKRQREPLPDYYQLLVKRLLRQGWERRPGETHAAFLARVLEKISVENRRGLEDLKRTLEADLYSPRSSAEAVRRELKRWAAILPLPAYSA